jgi:hypothetical protein
MPLTDENKEPVPEPIQPVTTPNSDVAPVPDPASDNTSVVEPPQAVLNTTRPVPASSSPIDSPTQPEITAAGNQIVSGLVQPSTPAPDSIPVTPQTEFVGGSLNSISSASIEEEENRRQKRKPLIIFLIIVAIVLLAGVGVLYYWYSQSDHSVYSKLTTESYGQNGIDFSFKYPSIMQSNPSIAAQEKNAPFAYSYYIGNNAQAIVFASYVPLSSILEQLDLTPAQFISQVRADSGSFITATNSAADFVGCNNTILTSSGQTDAVCINHPVAKNNSTYTNVRVVGATTSYQYTLNIDTLPLVWTSHQKVWQKVEKSFSYQ